MAGLPVVLFLMQVVFTLAMAGIIWFVQVVHYPLFARVGEAGFRAYAAAHVHRTTIVVLPLMAGELLTALACTWPLLRPAAITRVESWAGLALVVLLWACTGLVQVPLHDALQGGFTLATVQRLVWTNWLRTAMWTMRAGLVVVWLFRWLMVRSAL